MTDALRSAARAITSERFRRTIREVGMKKSLPRQIARYCRGAGIEVGAGPTPYCSPANTVFLDKHTDNAHGTPDADIVSDGASIPRPDESFDFLLSSHCLEHSQNTIRTLIEWRRVLKPGGVLFLILPHADRTFDRHRAKTTLDHHLVDYASLGDEPDRSHIDEMREGMAKLEDLEAMMAAHRRVWNADFWDWDHRLANDAMHFHVWTQDEIVRLVQRLNFAICFVDEAVPERHDSFVVIARKSGPEPELPKRLQQV